MDELTQKVYVRHVAQEAVRNRSNLDLRGLQLMAYASVMKAVRASGKLNERRRKFVGDVMEFFDISEERHASECRRVAAEPGLCRIAEGLHGEDAIDSWRVEGYGVFPPLPPFHRRSGRLKDCLAKEAEPPPTIFNMDGMEIEDVSDTEEYKMAAKIWNSKVTKVHKKVQTSKIAIKKRDVNTSEDESSDEKVFKQERETSPDITETPITPVKNKPVIMRDTSSIKRARGAKRKIPMMISRKININQPPQKILKKTTLKHKRPLKFPKGKAPKIKFVRKRPRSESSDRASSDDDISNKTNVIHDNLKIKIRAPTTRGRGLSRVRGRGVRGRGAGRGRIATNVNHDQLPRSEERVLDTIAPPSPTKTLKVLKPKKPKTISVSRRKSRLKEKEDDEMQMEWNDYSFDDDMMIMSNRRMPIKKRKHFPDEMCKLEANPGDSTNREDMASNINEIKRENGELDDNCHDGSENDRHSFTSDIIGRGDASSSRHSGNFSGEETDSASEKGSISGSRSIDSTGNNNNTRVSLSPPPVKPKQRLKPLINTPSSSSHPQLPRINLPPPVFSTSLSNVQKKRPKHISVVDSLNLHLPTTATASSLAASSSSRRPSIMGGSSVNSGCSIFSNSQALLANSRGGPGILQQQRKAHPHILANSKVHQRSFIPTTNSSNNVNVSVSVTGSNVNMSSNSAIATSTGTVMSPVPGVHQVQTTVMSTISSSPATVTMQLPGISGTPLAMGGAIPIGSLPVSRTPGTNIIFLQKASSAPSVVSTTVGIPTSSMPIKSSSRAVILRRTQLPRQGNVMILDVKNQVVNAGQVPQFLQTRILNPSPELSVLNLQGVQAQRKIIQPHPIEHSEPTISYSMAPVHNQRKTKVTGVPHLITTSAPSNIIETFRPAVSVTPSHPPIYIEDVIPVSVSSTTPSHRDTQMAEIEAQLMQMEEEVVYEEEVVTSSDTSEFTTATFNQLHDTGGRNHSDVIGPKEQPYCIGVNSVNMTNPYVSGSSTDTASEGETSFNASLNNTPEVLKHKSVEVSLTQQLEVRQMSDALTRAIVARNVNSTPKRSISNSITNNDNSGIRGSVSSTEGEDIFQAALKSSGIVFTEQQFYTTEEDIRTNADQLQTANQMAATNNYTAINQQGNGTSLQ